MTLVEQIPRDITEAMKARDSGRLSALRMLKAALMNSEVAKGHALEEGESQQVLTSLIKQRRDSIEQFKSGGRQDLVDKESAELVILERYAPPAASVDEIDAAVQAAITETSASGPKDMGRVMKAVMSALAGKSADGKVVNELVRKKTLRRITNFFASLPSNHLKGNAQASHPSSMGPPPKKRGPFYVWTHTFSLTSFTTCAVTGRIVRLWYAARK